MASDDLHPGFASEGPLYNEAVPLTKSSPLSDLVLGGQGLPAWQDHPVHFRVQSDPLTFILDQPVRLGMGQVGMSQEELTAIFYRGGSPLPCGSKKEYPSLPSRAAD